MVDTIKPPGSGPPPQAPGYLPTLESIPEDSPKTRGTGDKDLKKVGPDVEHAPYQSFGLEIPDMPELPPPETGRIDVANTLALIRGKVTEDMHQVSRTCIEQKKERHAELFKERMEHLQKSVDAMKNAQTWGIIGKVLGWVVPALTLAAGVVVTAASFWTGAGAAVGISLIAGGVMGLAMQTLQETGAMDHITKGIGEVFKAMGASEEVSKWLAFATVMAATFVIMVGVSFGAGAVGGWVGAGTRAAQAGTQAVTQAAAKAGAEYTLKVGTAVVQGAVTIGTKSVGVGKGVNESIAMFNKADAQSLHAQMKKVQQKLEEQTESLREIEEAYHKGNEIIMGVIGSQDKGSRKVLI